MRWIFLFQNLVSFGVSHIVILWSVIICKPLEIGAFKRTYNLIDKMGAWTDTLNLPLFWIICWKVLFYNYANEVKYGEKKMKSNLTGFKNFIIFIFSHGANTANRTDCYGKYKNFFKLVSWKLQFRSLRSYDLSIDLCMYKCPRSFID